VVGEVKKGLTKVILLVIIDFPKKPAQRAFFIVNSFFMIFLKELGQNIAFTF